MRLAVRVGMAAALLAAPSGPAGPSGPAEPAGPAGPAAPTPSPAPASAPSTPKPAPAPATKPALAPALKPTPKPALARLPGPARVSAVKVTATPTPAPTPTPAAADATPTPTPVVSASSSAAATATATLTTRTDHTVSLPPFGGRNTIPPWLKKVPSLRVLPLWPRQASHVRIFVHCPPKSNHALIGSTAFNLKGSRRIYREVGLGLSDRGLGHRAASISYYALPGFHEACLKCVKVTMNQQTRIRRIRVLGQDSTPLYVRRFSIWQFFD
ncbi:hypothetical protein [Streptosporangium sp. NPDC002721]|uniref:hypothetical protein n=1 Tax=Streptosporangium sp. NPDC002721 TaxID=3366188 RepID=UPI0036B276CB